MSWSTEMSPNVFAFPELIRFWQNVFFSSVLNEGMETYPLILELSSS